MTTNPNKVSQNILNQLPDFIKSDFPAFEKFLEYYYKSQEKTGQPQNILNELKSYLDIDSYDFGLIQSKTSLLEDVDATSDIITVESVDNFLDNNGSLLINDDTTVSPPMQYNQLTRSTGQDIRYFLFWTSNKLSTI